jgi:SAM-dependent methyltransferase
MKNDSADDNKSSRTPVEVRQAPYDEFSAAYAEHAASNPYQRFYDRPAILALAGSVAGKRVLDVGCAAGHLSSTLAEAGASVIAIDLGQRMVDLARRQFGERVRFERADLRKPLTILESDSVDVITASLVMHYLLDWGPTLREFRRVLRPGGVLVMSVHHPEDWHWFNRPDYFRTEQITDEFEIGAQRQQVQFYRRPLGKTFEALRQAGFAVDEIIEPMPLAECREVAPAAYEKLSTKPQFLYFRAINPERVAS